GSASGLISMPRV
uniref:Periviscerokinin-2 type 1 n=1 Tax=Celatoblatta sp. (strain Blue Mountains) TaxID=303880 RepID=PVK21_CELBM|nr:RecName: Full=Periviscerokinin-2 type 1; Short=PVK-2 type 1 [Celatoblatta sp. Blue Mountains]